MTGKKEVNSIETLLADLKTTIRLDLEEKDEEEEGEIVYKRQDRSNGNVETRASVETSSSTKINPDRLGYVMEIVTTPPTPSTNNPPPNLTNDNHVMASQLAQQNATKSLDSSLKSLRSNLSSPDSVPFTTSPSQRSVPFTQSPTQRPSPLHNNVSPLPSLKEKTGPESRRQSNKSIHSESQSISSHCDSHELSCDSVGYDSDSSIDSRTATIKPATTDFKTIQPINMQLHQSSNRLRDPLFHSNSDASPPKPPASNGTLPFSAPRRPSILRKPGLDKDTASETTSGISSQDMKIRFATSDTETQTSVEPTSLQAQSNPVPDTTIPLPEQQPNQTIFHLDKYTHLTKRKRSKGIPNVCTWFGMSAVEHLIQNTVNMSSWIWLNNNCNNNSTSGSNSTLHKTTCNSTPKNDRKSTPSPPAPSAPLMFPPVREWDSEKSLFEAMSDIGEQFNDFMDTLSPLPSKKGSRRGSQISLVDLVTNTISPDKDTKKKSGKTGKTGKMGMGGGRLRVPSKSDISTVKDSVKNSIIARCRSPRSVKKNSSVSSNGKVNSKPETKNGTIMSSIMSNLSSSSDKEEEEEKKKVEEETLKNNNLLELLKEDGFGDHENNLEERKRSQRGKKSGGGGGGGGGGRMRGGNTMMKCAMLDEVVKHAKTEDESISDGNGRGESKRSSRQSSRLEERLPLGNENQSLPR